MRRLRSTTPPIRPVTTSKRARARARAERVDTLRRVVARPAQGADAWDVLIVAGLASFAVGMWLLAPWIAFSVVGVVVFVIGLVGSILKARTAMTADADRRAA